MIAAAVELIEQVGLTRASISAIAERAGVERATVYRHFPDEQALFVGCMRYYIAACCANSALPHTVRTAAAPSALGQYRTARRCPVHTHLRAYRDGTTATMLLP